MDHRIEAENIKKDILKKMSPKEKFDQVACLRESAWQLKTAAIKALNPTWNEIQVREEVRKIFLYATT